MPTADPGPDAADDSRNGPGPGAHELTDDLAPAGNNIDETRASEQQPRLVWGPASTTYAGYRAAPPAERAAFWMLCSFATTIATSRAINYVGERRRPLPQARGVARILARLPGSNSVRVHHFLPGIGIGFTAGGTALLANPAPVALWLSVPFGAGVALTTDELRLLAGRNNPYWGGERFALTQCAGAALGAIGLGTLFHRRGRHGRDRR